jgi:hypothetical protein
LPKYTGSCICGSISFVVSMDPSEILSCPCSYCTKRALEFAVIEAPQIEFKSDKRKQNEQHYGSAVFRHLFCERCGAETMATIGPKNGSEEIAINIRCIDGNDFGNLPRRSFNCQIDE